MKGKKTRRRRTGAFPESQTRSDYRKDTKNRPPADLPPDAPRHMWRPLRRLLAAVEELNTAGAAMAGMICYRNVDGELSEIAIVDRLAVDYYTGYLAAKHRATSTESEVQA